MIAKKKMKIDLNHCQEIGQTCTVFNLRKASRAVTQLYEEIMRPSGILPTQFTLLAATRAMGPITISRMAKELVLDRTTLTRNLKPLEREGFLCVLSVKDDQRTREVSLTGKGLIKLEEVLPYWRDAQKKTRQALGSDRLDRLLVDLKITAGITSELS